MIDSKSMIWLGSFFSLLFITYCVTTHLDELNPNFASSYQNEQDIKKSIDSLNITNDTKFTKDVVIEDLNKKNSDFSKKTILPMKNTTITHIKINPEDRLHIEAKSPSKIKKDEASKESKKEKDSKKIKKQVKKPKTIHTKIEKIENKAKLNSKKKKIKQNSTKQKKISKKRVQKTKVSKAKRFHGSELIDVIALNNTSDFLEGQGNQINKIAFRYGLKNYRYIVIKGPDISKLNRLKKIYIKKNVDSKNIFIKQDDSEDSIFIYLRERR